MKETTHRPIEDIWYELVKHPDFIAGAYYDKGTILDYIADELQDGSYDDDDKLYKDAEWVIENNGRQIERNINSSWEFGMQDCIFSDDCDLPTEQTIQGVITKPIVESVEMIVSEEDMDIIKKHLLNK